MSNHELSIFALLKLDQLSQLQISITLRKLESSTLLINKSLLTIMNPLSDKQTT